MGLLVGAAYGVAAVVLATIAFVEILLTTHSTAFSFPQQHLWGQIRPSSGIWSTYSLTARN